MSSLAFLEDLLPAQWQTKDRATVSSHIIIEKKDMVPSSSLRQSRKKSKFFSIGSMYWTGIAEGRRIILEGR